MKDNNKIRINDILLNAVKINSYYPLIIISFFSFIIFAFIFCYHLNSQILIQSKNLETLSKIYESSIIVSFNNDSENLYKQSKFQVENVSNITVVTFYNESDYNILNKDCLITNNKYLIIRDKKICFFKKITYSKNQFYYIIKSDFNMDYYFFIILLIAYLMLIIISYFLSVLFISKNKKFKILSDDVFLYDECLKYIENKEYNLINDKIVKMKIYELQNAILEISESNRLKSKAILEAENKAIIIHDTTKIMDCIPLEISNESIKKFVSIISNIKNILRLDFNLENQFDIKKCIIEGAGILSLQGILIDLTKVKSCIFFGKESLLTEVFSNVFSNIIEHSVLEYRKVVLYTYLEKKEDNLYYHCIIRNYGSYVPKDNFELIFQKNYTSSIKNKDYGTGLYFCKNVISNFGGKVFCNSENCNNPKDSYFEINIELPVIYEEKNQDESISNENFIISILEDDHNIIRKWKEKLGDENVFYFDNPQDFLMEYRENCIISKTSLIVSDFYFHNIPLYKLLDFDLLRNVLNFKGKIFLHTNVTSPIPNKEKFDYLISSKNEILDKNKLISIFNNINKLN